MVLLNDIQNRFIKSLYTDISRNFLIHAQNLDQYKYTILFNLENILSKIYALTKKKLGDKLFAQAADDYHKTHSLNHPVLLEYSRGFSQFISTYKPTEHLRYLSELTHMEWVCIEVAYSDKYQCMDERKANQIYNYPFDQLFCQLNPSGKLLRFVYPINKIMSAIQTENNQSDDYEPEEDFLLIARQGIQTNLYLLCRSEYNCLKNIEKNQSLAAAYDSAIHYDSHFSIVTKLMDWIDTEIIVDWGVVE